MRPPVCASHLRFLCQATALATIAVLAGCSSDAMRFEEQLTTATTLTANQQAVVERNGPVSQFYPDDATETTNSVRVSPLDAARYNRADAKSVNADSQVLVPTYTFSASAPVSAPDNDPATKASRSSRGFEGQVRTRKVALPQQRGTVRIANAAPTHPTVTGSVPGDSQPKTKSVKRAASPETTDIAARATEAVENPSETRSSAFRWPVRGRIIKKFGERKGSGANDGIDISVPVGTLVKASENGTVIYSGSELGEFGNLVLISHAGGWVSAYGNASSRLVKRGDKVRRGQVIAKSGKSGNATVPQLHFELRKNSKPVDPLGHLSKG